MLVSGRAGVSSYEFQVSRCCSELGWWAIQEVAQDLLGSDQCGVVHYKLLCGEVRNMRAQLVEKPVRHFPVLSAGHKSMLEMVRYLFIPLCAVWCWSIRESHSVESDSLQVTSQYTLGWLTFVLQSLRDYLPNCHLHWWPWWCCFQVRLCTSSQMTRLKH